MPETTEAYAKCVDCGIELADRDAITAHGRETMAPTGETGIVARGHRVSIVNPTEAERRESRLRMHIADALDDLYDALYERVDRDEFTAEEISKAMWVFDLRDGWDDYASENDDDEPDAERLQDEEDDRLFEIAREERAFPE